MALSSLRCFNTPYLRSALRPWAARQPTAGHASVAGPPGNSSGCPAWRLRPVARRSAGPASGAAYRAMRPRRRRRAIHRLGRRMLLGVRAHAGGLVAALRRRSGTGILVCGTAHVAGPGPCGAGAKDDDGATGRISRFMFMRVSSFFLSRPDGAGDKRNPRHGCRFRVAEPISAGYDPWQNFTDAKGAQNHHRRNAVGDGVPT